MAELTDEEQAELVATNAALAEWAVLGVKTGVEDLRRRIPGFGLTHLSLAQVERIAEEAAISTAMGIVVALREHGIRLRVPKPDGE